MTESNSNSNSEQSVPEPCREESAGAVVIDNGLEIKVRSNGTVVAVNAVPGSRLIANFSRTLDQTQISFTGDSSQASHVRIKIPGMDVTILPPQQEPSPEGTHSRLDGPNEEHQAPVADDADHQVTTGLLQNQVSPPSSEHNTGLDALEPSGEHSTNVTDNTANQDDGTVSRHDDLPTIVSSEQGQIIDRTQKMDETENTNLGTGGGADRELPIPNGVSDETSPNVPPPGADIQDVDNVDTHDHGTNGAVDTEVPGIESRDGGVPDLSNHPRPSNVHEIPSVQTPSFEEEEPNGYNGSGEGQSHLSVLLPLSPRLSDSEPSERRVYRMMNEMLYVGLVGPIVWKYDQFFVVIVDAFSGLVQLELTRVKDESNVVSALKRYKEEKTRNLLAIKVICTDGSQLFSGPELRAWCEENKLRHDSTNNEAVHSNEIVRKFIRRVKKTLNRMSYEGKCPSTAVKDLEDILNHSTDEITEF